MKLMGRDIPARELLARIEERLRTRGLPTSEPADVPEEVWKGPVKECCPGIDEGPLVPAADVERIARETEEWFEPPARPARGARRKD